MGAFKFIYFWEYIHRLWARTMGMVFLIPFLLFWITKQFDKRLFFRLVIVFLLAALVASFGWIMVASGLINRPWVNAYKLTMHLSLALVLYSYLFWTTLNVFRPGPPPIQHSVLRKWSNVILLILAVQIILGGIVSGMKAGLVYPTWPDMNGSFIPDVLLHIDMWNVENFLAYDGSTFMPAFIQFFHRMTAYLLVGLICWFAYHGIKETSLPSFRNGQYLLVFMVFLQALVGILTVVNCIGQIPVGLGVLHQAGRTDSSLCSLETKVFFK